MSSKPWLSITIATGWGAIACVVAFFLLLWLVAGWPGLAVATLWLVANIVRDLRGAND